MKKIKILIIQPQGIGDQIMITPLLQLIKSNYKNSLVRIVVSSMPAKSVVMGSSLVDEVIVFNRRKNNIFGYLRLLWKNFIFSPDISFVTPYVSLFLGQASSFLSGAKIRIGEDKTMPIAGYTHFNSECRNMHKVDANIFLFNIGLKLSGDAPRPYFHLNSKEKSYGESFFLKKRLRNCIVMGLHVGCDSNSKYRRYPLERFQNIINNFIKLKSNHRVVCFFGPDETLLSNSIERHPSVLIVKEKPIQHVASIIRKLDVMLSTDSSLGHVATAFGTPCVSIMGPADSMVTSPYGDMHSVVETAKNLLCKPCIHSQKYTDCLHFDCLNTIDESTILLKVLEKI